jgi:hypothetical protein
MQSRYLVLETNPYLLRTSWTRTGDLEMIIAKTQRNIPIMIILVLKSTWTQPNLMQSAILREMKRTFARDM